MVVNKLNKISISILFLFGLYVFAQEKDSLLLKLRELEAAGQFEKILMHHRAVRQYGADYYTIVAEAFNGLNKEDSAFHFYKLAKDGFFHKNLFQKEESHAWLTELSRATSGPIRDVAIQSLEAREDSAPTLEQLS